MKAHHHFCHIVCRDDQGQLHSIVGHSENCLKTEAQFDQFQSFAYCNFRLQHVKPVSVVFFYKNSHAAAIKADAMFALDQCLVSADVLWEAIMSHVNSLSVAPAVKSPFHSLFNA